MHMNDAKVVISASDAELLLKLLLRSDQWDADIDCGDTLTQMLQVADIVPDACFPLDRVGMGCEVFYEDLCGSIRHGITLTEPVQAVPDAGLVSVFSPLGAAIMGKSIGEEVDVPLPQHRLRTLRILALAGPAGLDSATRAGGGSR